MAVRLSAGPLGGWSRSPLPDPTGLTGVEVPVSFGPPSADGFWTDDPALSARVRSFVESTAPARAETPDPPRFKLHARRDAVIGHLRADCIDDGAAGADTLDALVDLLDAVAAYVEAHDDALTERLGVVPGVHAVYRLAVVAMLVVAVTGLALYLVVR